LGGFHASAPGSQSREPASLSNIRETRTKSFSYFVEDQRKRLAVRISAVSSEVLLERCQMIGLKLIVVLLGAGLLLSLLFSSFGTEEAFILLAAIFA
jgi:hypothetical protein